MCLRTVKHLGHLALSGVGLLVLKATAVEPEGRISTGALGLWDDATEAALRPVLALIQRYPGVLSGMFIW